MWTFLKFLGAAAILYAAIVALMFFTQRRLLYFPTAGLVADPSQAGLPHEDIRLTTDSGTRIHGWWLPHPEPRFTLLFFHGNGGNISHRLDSLRIFHDLGLSVLIIDYSGYGQSEGSPSETALMADAHAAWKWLIREQEIAPERIILFGRSLGGGVAAGLAGELAAQDIHPGGLILESTFTSVPDMGARLYPWLPVRLLARDRFDSVRALTEVTVHGLFLHSPNDEIVPFELGRNLYDSYGGPKTFAELTGDHNGGFLLTGDTYIQTLDAYLSNLRDGRP